MVGVRFDVILEPLGNLTYLTDVHTDQHTYTYTRAYMMGFIQNMIQHKHKSINCPLPPNELSPQKLACPVCHTRQSQEEVLSAASLRGALLVEPV